MGEKDENQGNHIITLSLPFELWKKGRKFAIDKKQTFSNLISELLEKKLEEDSNDR